MTDTPTPEMASDENIDLINEHLRRGIIPSFVQCKHVLARLNYEIAERKKVEHERDLERRALAVVLRIGKPAGYRLAGEMSIDQEIMDIQSEVTALRNQGETT